MSDPDSTSSQDTSNTSGQRVEGTEPTEVTETHGDINGNQEKEQTDDADNGSQSLYVN
jgi:hypothetical protein